MESPLADATAAAVQEHQRLWGEYVDFLTVPPPFSEPQAIHLNTLCDQLGIEVQTFCADRRALARLQARAASAGQVVCFILAETAEESNTETR